MRLEEGVNLNDPIDCIGVLLYSGEGERQTEEFLQRPLQSDGEVKLIKQQDSYWLTKKVDEEWSQETLERIVGLTFTVVCVELANSVETYVERLFYGMQSQGESSNLTHLICVKDTYGVHNDYHQQNSTIFVPSLTSISLRIDLHQCIEVATIRAA